MRRAYWLIRVRLIEIELNGGNRSARGRLARARGEYCATFPPGVRFTWREA